MPTGIADVLVMEPGVLDSARCRMFITLYGCAAAMDVRPDYRKISVADCGDIAIAAINLGVLKCQRPLTGIGLIAIQVDLAIHFGIFDRHVGCRNAQPAIDQFAIDDRA